MRHGDEGSIVYELRKRLLADGNGCCGVDVVDNRDARVRKLSRRRE